MTKFPLINYPTLTLWVDDDALFLDAIKISLKDSFEAKYFSNPLECINFLNEYEAAPANKPLLKAFEQYEEYDLINHLPVDIDFKSISDLVNNPTRNQEVSVIVVDYNMPEKNGIELCRELNQLPIKKLLLTGEASNKLAIDAFNEGIIDSFISKDSSNLMSELLIQIAKLKNKFFQEKTHHLLTHLEADYSLPYSDQNFSNFFQKYCESNEIIEYFPIDKNGSLLIKNSKGHEKFFIVHTSNSLSKFCELYKDDSEVTYYLNLIEKREKIPFFGLNKEAWDYEFHLWDRFFFAAEIFEGKEKYFWSVLEA